MEKSGTKEKIFRSAAELFSRNGYYSVSVNEICMAAGVTKPVLYYYFNDKEDLLLKLANEAHEVIEKLGAKYLSESNSFIKNLENINKLYLHYTKEYTYLIPFSFWVQFVPVPDKVKKVIAERIERRWEFLNSLFVKGQQEGYLDPGINPSLLMRSLFNPLSVILVQYVLAEEKTDSLEAILKEYFEFWLNHFIIKKE